MLQQFALLAIILPQRDSLERKAFFLQRQLAIGEPLRALSVAELARLDLMEAHLLILAQRRRVSCLALFGW